ncbi:MAG: choice-of-anchor I family protein, partial [Verrucomicrobiales bacterium]
PDMITFSHDGTFLLSANEGEPSDDYNIDPEGSISVIQIPADIQSGFAPAATLSFSKFNGKEIDGINPGNPDSSLAQNLEPEYIAISPDGKIGMVSLQESNAVAILDLTQPAIVDVVGLGFQDHREVAFDASDKDGKINIQNWPVYGLYQPDTIISFEVDGKQYFATANEGDARDYDGWSEESRLKDLDLDPAIFPNADELQSKENLGRLKVTTAMGDLDGDGDFEEVYNFGGRSFSILDENGSIVYDSGSVIEEKLAELIPENFNSNNDENDSFDKRSDDKGPEPEAIAFANLSGTPMIFVGLERVGGVMAFDVSDPTAPVWLTYVNTRNFAGDPENGTAGDLGPEGIIFIDPSESPNGEPLLVVSNEVSGSVVIFEISE